MSHAITFRAVSPLLALLLPLLLSVLPALLLSGLMAAPAARAADDGAWRISTRGYGPVRAGLSTADAARRLGTALQADFGRVADPECALLTPARGHDGLVLMVQHGRISRVAVSSPAVATLSGVRVGDDSARLRAVYGPRLEVEPHKYEDNAFYFFLWEADRRHGVKFEVAADRVRTIYAGDDSIAWVEGCA